MAGTPVGTQMSESALRRGIVAQFGHPRGPLGWLAGRIMLARGSNRARTRWAIDLLAPAPTSHILEIGFGPGYSLEVLAARVPGAELTGIDHSPLMVATAERRLAARNIVAHLHCASVAALPDFPAAFDRVLAVNSVQFWPDPVSHLGALRERMNPGGTMVLVVQPRCRGATPATSQRTGEQLVAYLRAAGFGAVEAHYNGQLKPIPGAAAVGCA